MIRPFCKTVVGLLVVAACLLFRDADARLIPAFARKYGVSCSLCHTVVPKLSAYGEVFAGNGFRMAPGGPPRDTLDTGDRMLQLMKSFPLAARLDAYTQAYINGANESDLQLPYNVKLLSGGEISSSLSYYFYFFLFERGEVGGIEDAYVYWNDIGGIPLDGAVGQFQVSDPMFKRELRLSYQDYVVYRARVGYQPADLTYDRGVMAIGDVGRLTLAGQIVNGNGRGEAEPDRQLDNDPHKNLFGHVSASIVPQFRLGAMGYYGKQNGAADETAPVLTNTLWMAGADATLSVGAVELNLQYLHREDDNPTFAPSEPKAITNGGFAELIVHPSGKRWYAFGLYNFVDCNQPLLSFRLGGPSDVDRYQAIAAGAGYTVRRNFRLLFEGNWDIELEATRWTLGLSTAF
ncbi:MAG: hypothetical protein JSW43_07230 [Gemmatimonadota bacterium]|nr:MAG: hypothetical protein JSW43_07230 [Gemmatimonadota bacterium]